MHWMEWYDNGWIMMGIGWMVVLGVIILVAIVLGGHESSETKQKIALEILSQRYARGEISKEEFESKKTDLN